MRITLSYFNFSSPITGLNIKKGVQVFPVHNAYISPIVASLCIYAFLLFFWCTHWIKGALCVHAPEIFVLLESNAYTEYNRNVCIRI